MPTQLVTALARRPILGSTVAAVPAVFFSVAWWRDRGLSSEESPVHILVPFGFWAVAVLVGGVGGYHRWRRQARERFIRDNPDVPVPPPGWVTGSGFWIFVFATPGAIALALILGQQFVPYSDGISTNAVVISSELSDANVSNSSYETWIEFELESGEVFTTEWGGKQQYDIGHEIAISYRPADPAAFREPSMVVVGMCALIGLLGVLALTGAWLTRPRRIEPDPRASSTDVVWFGSIQEPSDEDHWWCVVLTRSVLHVWQTGRQQHQALLSWLRSGGVPDRSSIGPKSVAITDIERVHVDETELRIERRHRKALRIKGHQRDPDGFIRAMASLNWKLHHDVEVVEGWRNPTVLNARVVGFLGGTFAILGGTYLALGDFPTLVRVAGPILAIVAWLAALAFEVRRVEPLHKRSVVAHAPGRRVSTPA